MRRKLFAVLFACLMVATLVGPVAATPVATTPEEHELLGRVFPEPIESVDYIQYGSGTRDEFVPGMQFLEELYPQYLEFTTVAEQLETEFAVTVGADGLPAWHPDDSDDGNDLHLAVVTDESVPDEGKAYVAVMFSHSAEPCGREAAIRTIEDLAIWATEQPALVLDDGEGVTGETHEYTAAEILAKTKIFVMFTSPDGWASGDDASFKYSQENGAGINSNRVAYQTGWVFPNVPEMYDNGYTVMTQPAGAAYTMLMRKIRAEELGGRPFANAADIHGPVPFGMILLHDQGNDAQKLERIWDLGNRVKQNMDEVFTAYATGVGADGYAEAARGADTVRKELAPFTPPEFGVAHAVPLQWATVSHIWDLLSYTASSTWGGWANSDLGGLGADSLSYEINCVVAKSYDPASMQLLVDNARSIIQTHLVAAAAVTDGSRAQAFEYDLGGPVGFYEAGERITDADGNPSPPPDGFPGTPLVGQLEQVPYDVANTDYFRDLSDKLVTSPIVEITPDELPGSLDRVATFVVADQGLEEAPDAVPALMDFVEAGGNLVLTDSALGLAGAMLGLSETAVQEHVAYVGYADLDRNHPMTEGLPERARQTYDPIGLGYELLMERDGYWSSQEVSGTENRSPVFTIDRGEFEEAGGVTVATADPLGPKAEGEGAATDKTTIGILERGAGRLIVMGAILPQPTEEFPHWFGLDPYTVSVPGQHLLMRAMTWERAGLPDPSAAPAVDEAPTEPDSPSLPSTGAGAALPGAVAVLLLGVAITRRRRA